MRAGKRLARQSRITLVMHARSLLWVLHVGSGAGCSGAVWHVEVAIWKAVGQFQVKWISDFCGSCTMGCEQVGFGYRVKPPHMTGKWARQYER